MIAVNGIYQDGYVKLDTQLSIKTPVKVIVTFLDDIEASSEKGLSLKDFSFAKSQKILSDYESSFSETVVEERRNDL